jgi:transposase
MGAPWRNLPECFGPWTSVYTRFDTWSKRGAWQDVLEWLRKDADLEWVLLDGPIARAHDSFLYKARHAIENGFARLKQFRRLATRFDKSARNYAAQAAIACIVLWLRL